MVSVTEPNPPHGGSRAPGLSARGAAHSACPWEEEHIGDGSSKALKGLVPVARVTVGR